MSEANPRPATWPRWDLQKKQPADPNPNFQPQKCEWINDHAMLVNPNENQILPTAFNLLHAEAMMTTQLHGKSTCEGRSQELCKATIPAPSSYISSQPSVNASDTKGDIQTQLLSYQVSFDS